MSDQTNLLIYIERLKTEMQSMNAILKRQRADYPDELNGESAKLHVEYLKRLDDSQNTLEALRQSVHELITRKGK